MMQEWELPESTEVVRIAWRLGSAALLGSAIGMEREWMRKAAGLRTHATVAVASAAFVLIALEMGGDDADVSRVIQGVAAGIGFLGAGTILKPAGDESGIQGLTTAATIWLTAAVGVAAGAGHSTIAAIAVIIGWLILTILAGLKRLIGRSSGHGGCTESARGANAD
jgi:putative Mg2+ transporter-C (MgtC) family protein